MEPCYIEFVAASTDKLARTEEVFSLVRAMKSGHRDIDEDTLTALLTPQEQAYFTQFSPEEWNEWNDHWKKTPVAVRISPAMVCPQWDLPSMYEAIWNGEYELGRIAKADNGYRLTFEPGAYPYGGISCLLAFIECFGHRIIGHDDGTGYVRYEPRPVWKPSKSQ